MMRSLSSAVAGLRTHQTKMDVIGNNIANVNTYGFKASRTTFADVYYQNLSYGSGPSTATGGTNPTQIGYGSLVGSIDVMITQSGASSTDRALDVYISGDGFLVTQDASGNFFFTRMGALGFDAEGNLVDVNGNYVMGFQQNDDGSPQIPASGIAENSDSLKNITVNPDLLDKLTGISISSGGEIVGILPGDAKITLGSGLPSWVIKGSETLGADSVLQGNVKLNVGGLFDATTFNGLGLRLADGTTPVTFVSASFGDVAIDADDAEWYVKNNTLYMEGYRTNEDGSTTKVSASGTLSDGKIQLKDSNGKLLMTVETDAAKGASLKDVGSKGGGAMVTLASYYQIKTTDRGGNVVVEPADPTVTPTGNPTKLSIKDLEFEVDFSNPVAFAGTVGKVGTEEGTKINIGCIVLAKFRNPAGMEQSGSTSFTETANSGGAQFVKPGLEGTGGLKANYLEMSNVDISKEFTDMITTQRGFQANSRIVTVSDEMLQELVNLKR